MATVNLLLHVWSTLGPHLRFSFSLPLKISVYLLLVGKKSYLIIVHSVLLLLFEEFRIVFFTNSLLLSKLHDSRWESISFAAL